MAKTNKKNTKINKKKRASKKNRTRKYKKQLKEPENEIVVGMLYADWCPHCQTVKPEWETLRTMLPPNYEVIKIEEQDPNKTNIISRIEERMNGNHIENRGYPTIFKVNGNRADYYEGERTAELIGGWAMTNMNGGFQANKQKTPYKPYNRTKSRSKRR